MRVQDKIELDMLTMEYRLLTLQRNAAKDRIEVVIKELGEVKKRTKQIRDRIWELKHGKAIQEVQTIQAAQKAQSVQKT